MVTACGAQTAILIVRIAVRLAPAELVVNGKALQFLVDNSPFAGNCNAPRRIAAMRPQKIE